MISQADADLYDEPFFPEEEDGTKRRLDYFGHTFPPLQREIRRRLHHHFRERKLEAAWYVPRTLGDGLYGDFQDARDAADLPPLVSGIGLGAFTRPAFSGRWQAEGVFQETRQTLTRREFIEAGFADPLGLFHVYGAGAWVILADPARLDGRPLPRCWEDLLAPCYHGDIVANGAGGQLSPVLLFNFHRDFGADGIRALAPNLRDFWGGAKMARMAGTDDPQGAALYILPHFWAVNNIHPDRARMVWPREGAYATPLFLLHKHESNAAAQAARDFLTGPEWARTMESVCCSSIRDDTGAAPLPGALRWIGWEQARSLDFAALRPTLDGIITKGMRQ
jgi:ABC-type Fe3+ transport system, periplasmic component